MRAISGLKLPLRSTGKQKGREQPDKELDGDWSLIYKYLYVQKS